MRKFKNPSARSNLLFFWGTFILCCGVGFLISRYGIYDFGNVFISSVLGMLLIIVGISCLQIPNWLKKVMVGLRGVIASLLVLAIFASIDNDYGRLATFNSKSDDSQNTADDYPVKAFQSVETNTPLDTYDFNIIAANAEINLMPDFSKIARYWSTESIDRRFILNTGNMKDGKIFLYPQNSDSTLAGKLQLFNKPFWNINLDVQNIKINADLSQIPLKGFHLIADYINGSITLGKARKNCDIIIESNQSSEKLVLTIPKNTYCEIISNSLPSGTHLPYFKEVDPGLYQSVTGDSLYGKYYITLTGQFPNLEIHRSSNN